MGVSLVEEGRSVNCQSSTVTPILLAVGICDVQLQQCKVVQIVVSWRGSEMLAMGWWRLTTKVYNLHGERGGCQSRLDSVIADAT